MPYLEELWTLADQERAVKEGWLITNNREGVSAVARVDDPLPWTEDYGWVLDYSEPLFQWDEEAENRVIAQASQGSILHLRALYVCGHPYEDPDGNQWLPELLALVDPSQGEEVMAIDPYSYRQQRERLEIFTITKDGAPIVLGQGPGRRVELVVKDEELAQDLTWALNAAAQARQ